MTVVTTLDQIKDNIAELERGRASRLSSKVAEYRALIKRGTCFVPYVAGNGLAFAPSRFVGYRKNKLATHADNPDRDGRITNAAINKIIGSKPQANALLEGKYSAFCVMAGVQPSITGAFGVVRKYWITEEIVGILESDVEKEITQDPEISETEKQQLVKARIGQGQFRDRLLSYWRKCCLTGCDHQSILRASHIKPWRDCTNSERLDVFNGLLLVPNMDTLFDKGLISFSSNGEILVSHQLSENNQSALGLSEEMQIVLAPEHEKYIAWHRDNIFASMRHNPTVNRTLRDKAAPRQLPSR